MSERVTVREAADALGVSQATVRRRIEKGDLDAVKVPNGNRGSVWMVALAGAAPEDPPNARPDQTMLGRQAEAESTIEAPLGRDMLQIFLLTFIPGAFAFGILWGLTGNAVLGALVWVAVWVAASWRAGLFDRLGSGSFHPRGISDQA